MRDEKSDRFGGSKCQNGRARSVYVEGSDEAEHEARDVEQLPKEELSSLSMSVASETTDKGISSRECEVS